MCSSKPNVIGTLLQELPDIEDETVVTDESDIELVEGESEIHSNEQQYVVAGPLNSENDELVESTPFQIEPEEAEQNALTQTLACVK